MGLFDVFRTNDSETKLRRRLEAEFENCVQTALNKRIGEPMLDAMLVQAAVGSFYQSMKDAKELETFCIMEGLDYQEILSEECTKVLNKYLQ